MNASNLDQLRIERQEEKPSRGPWRWLLPLLVVLVAAAGWWFWSAAGGPVEVVRGLGGGSQGQVYEVEVSGERLALKWFLPACIARDRTLSNLFTGLVDVVEGEDGGLAVLGLMLRDDESALNDV